MIYFNAWGIATLICCVFTLLILGYLLTLKNKSRNTMIVVYFFLGAFILDFGFLWGAILPAPLGGHHRFITVGGVFTPIIFMVAFAYYFPRLEFAREARIALALTTLFSLGLAGHFFWQALRTQPDFTFAGDVFNYFESNGQPMGKLVSYGILLMVFWFIVVMIRKARRLEGEERRAQIQLLFAMTVPALGPGIANMLWQRGVINHGAFQQIFVVLTLVGYFAIAIVFINNTVERTSFMTKIVGISIMTILLVVQGVFSVINGEFERKFDRMNTLDARTYLLAGNPVPENAAYVFSYSLRPYQGEGARILFNRHNHSFDLAAVTESFRAEPAPPVGVRIPRQAAKFSDQLYFGYRVRDEASGRVYEIGFPYLYYRSYANGFASKVAVMLGLLVIMILVLYPVFFSRTLVRPLNALLEGVGEVNVGNLRIAIPVMVQDEIGYLSESFNRMVRSILDAKNKLQEYADTLEEKVIERTKEVQEKLEVIEKLKVQQDGDYYLTALIGKPLAMDWNKSETVRTDFFMEQKKKFSFRERDSELGGDICIAGNLRFKDAGRFTVFCNGDAMGKSMQGAGGAIVLGTVMNNIMSRSARNDRVLQISPEQWLANTYSDLDDTFRTFDGVMMASVVLGIVSETTGKMYYFNAEHPWSVLYRDGRAQFIEKELTLRKLGSLSEYKFRVHEFQLEPGDVLFAGSDGRDDIDTSDDPGVRVINEDENVFLDTVQEARGQLDRVVELIRAGGHLTDDLSLIRVEFAPVGARERGVSVSEDESWAPTPGLARGTESSTNLEGLSQRSQELFDRKEYEAAAAQMRELLDIRPDVADVWFNLSLCYKHLKRIEDAAYAGEKLYNLQPNRVANLINLADNYRILGQFSQSRDYLRRALELNPDSENGRRLDELLKARGA